MVTELANPEMPQCAEILDRVACASRMVHLAVLRRDVNALLEALLLELLLWFLRPLVGRGWRDVAILLLGVVAILLLGRIAILLLGRSICSGVW